MLSTEMASNESFNKEKKRKKYKTNDEIHVPIKKAKITNENKTEQLKVETLNKELFNEFMFADILKKAEEIEDEYVTSSDEEVSETKSKESAEKSNETDEERSSETDEEENIRAIEKKENIESDEDDSSETDENESSESDEEEVENIKTNNTKIKTNDEKMETNDEKMETDEEKMKTDDEESIETDDEEKTKTDEPEEKTKTDEAEEIIAGFDIKKFRRMLQKEQSGYRVLKDFVAQCTKVTSEQDIALEYLENGGNTAEIIRVLDIAESKTASFSLPIIEALTIVLVKIISDRPEKQVESEESCREFIIKYHSIIKTMMALNSTTKQRKTALKLLSVLASLSASTAKEILSHVIFDQSILMLLYQPSDLEDGSSVRTHFIHFLISFLVDGDSATIINFLEKRGLLASIFPGLIYDTPEVVNLVLSTLQTKILENKDISKTVKMSLFSTKTIQIIINAFNWKGPRAWNPKKRKESKFVVNQEKQTEVCLIVQKFLTCLCASKNGIIFFDPFVGLNRKQCNPLLVTILSSLNKPWTNVYKKELIIKICIACPDVVKSVLANIEGFLEPGVSNNWLNVIGFIRELIESLTPEAVEPFLKELLNRQFSGVMQLLCVPQSVLTKIVAGMAQDYLQIRQECANLLNTMLNSANNYLKFVKKIPTLQIEIIKEHFSNYLMKCLPLGSVLLKDWYKSIQAANDDSSNVDKEQLNKYLTKLLDVLYQYNTFCPGLVENITNDIDLKPFLETIDTLSVIDKNSYDMHIKAINLLISCDITIFAPSKEYFSYAVSLLMKFYYHTDGDIQIEIENMLFVLFKLTNIFDYCVDEIMIWLYSILEQPTYDEKFVKFLTQVLIKTNNDFLKYSNAMTDLRDEFTEGDDYRLIIESLASETHNVSKINATCKHRILSPFILGFLDLLLLKKKNSLKSYLNISLMNLLHYQTNPIILVNIVLQKKYNNIIETNLQSYFAKWKLNKIVSKVNIVPEDSVYYKLIHFLSKEDISDLEKFTEYCSENSKYYTKTLMTNLIMFYYTQRSAPNTLEISFQEKSYAILLYIIKNIEGNQLNYCLKSIFNHPILLESFRPTFIHKESHILSTEFIINIITELLETKTKSEMDVYLNAYQAKLVEQICDMLQNYSTNIILFNIEPFMDIVKLFDLSYNDCSEILNILSKLPLTSFKSDEKKSSVVLKLQSFILGHESNYTKFEPFSNEILGQLNSQMIELNCSELNLSELELNLHNYIKQFPHTNINFDHKLFESIITKPTITKSSIQLATIMLQKNNKYLEIFIKHLDAIYDKRELVFSLINSVMNTKTETVKTLLEMVYKKYEEIIMKYLNKPQKAASYLVANYQVIIKLIVEQLKPETCKQFCAKTHKFDASEIHHFETLTTIFNKTIMAETTENLKQKYVMNYITTSMNLLVNLFKRPTKTDEDWNKSENIAKQFNIYMIKVRNVYKIDLKEQKLYSGVFQTFAKLCLKFGLQEKPIFVNLLKQLCSLSAENSNIDELGVLFEMAISHSESLNILLSEDVEKKAPLLSLLLTVCKRSKSVMIKSHIPIWLSAYEATLSESDQYLLQLLCLYEAANIGFHEYRPYLWGKAAVAHYSVKSSIENTIWRQPKPKEVLDLLDEDRIIHTVRHFPWMRGLKNDTLYSDSDIEVYDPAFYLPMLSHLLAPESTIRWYHCTQRGIISLPIIALTSENEEIRAAACNVLARFHGHLEAATYAKQRFLWLHLIEAVCRGTSILPSLRPCTIVAVFLARCSIIFTRADHPLYSTLGNYISAKECPNFNVVPELLSMLHSTDINHNAHRNFILEVIRDGLCTDEDLKVLYKSVAFKLIMGLYNNVLTDSDGKKLILEILAAAATLQNGAKTLVFNYNIISWLHAVLQQFNKNNLDQLSVFIKIINNLITTFHGELFKHLQFNVLLLLVSVIDVFKNARLHLMDLVKFIQILYKVYDINPKILTKIQLVSLLKMSSRLNCKVCNYYLEFGADFIETPTLVSDDPESVGCYYLKLLTLKWIQTNKNL